MTTKTKKLNIQWTTEVRQLEGLKDWEKNPRKITKDEFEALKAGIEKRGFHDVLKVDVDGTIISGHQRKRALEELGVQEITVMVPDRPLTEEEKDIIAVESNMHRGSFDWDTLANGFDIDDLLEAGFTKQQLGFMTSKEAEGMDADTLAASMETYLSGNMKQVTLYFSNEEYEELLPRLDKVMSRETVSSHTEAFLKLLEFYEKNN